MKEGPETGLQLEGQGGGVVEDRSCKALGGNQALSLEKILESTWRRAT